MGGGEGGGAEGYNCAPSNPSAETRLFPLLYLPHDTLLCAGRRCSRAWAASVLLMWRKPGPAVPLQLQQQQQLQLVAWVAAVPGRPLLAVLLHRLHAPRSDAVWTACWMTWTATAAAAAAAVTQGRMIAMTRARLARVARVVRGTATAEAP